MIGTKTVKAPIKVIRPAPVARIKPKVSLLLEHKDAIFLPETKILKTCLVLAIKIFQMTRARAKSFNTISDHKVSKRKFHCLKLTLSKFKKFKEFCKVLL